MVPMRVPGAGACEITAEKPLSGDLMTNSEQRRLTHWRLRLLQAARDAGNVARTYRHFAISRKTFYSSRNAP